MDDWLVTLITAVGILGGSALTGGIAIRVARIAHEASDKQELRTAMAAYGAAIDRVTMRIDQMPQSHGIEEGWKNNLVARWKTLDWALGQVSIVTVGRGTMRVVVDEVIATTNRLVLLAPESVLETVASTSDLISDFEPSLTAWREEWAVARTRFMAVAREASLG